MVEGARLLSEYTGKPVSRVRIPPSPFQLFNSIEKFFISKIIVYDVKILLSCPK